MNDAYYEQILDKALEKFISLASEKERLEDEIAKVQQFMYATMNLLSDEASDRVETKLRPWVEKIVGNVASLRDSIKKVLVTSYPSKLTAAQVRDQLRAIGFDFSSYKSDPLPSVSTTLRRLRESGDVLWEEFEGVIVYQGKPIPSDHPANKLKAPDGSSRMRMHGAPERIQE